MRPPPALLGDDGCMLSPVQSAGGGAAQIRGANPYPWARPESALGVREGESGSRRRLGCGICICPRGDLQCSGRARIRLQVGAELLGQRGLLLGLEALLLGLCLCRTLCGFLGLPLPALFAVGFRDAPFVLLHARQSPRRAHLGAALVDVVGVHLAEGVAAVPLPGAAGARPLPPVHPAARLALDALLCALPVRAPPVPRAHHRGELA
mmetsp:Transcript_6933/g.23679  ORF Transcript_6933/g.23679 Transcript_6933/m.23679 type:complete len:208 (-) Transcript_6933:917-1540(-)